MTHTLINAAEKPYYFLHVNMLARIFISIFIVSLISCSFELKGKHLVFIAVYANVLNHWDLTFCSLQAVLAKPGFFSAAATDVLRCLWLLVPDSEANEVFFGAFVQDVVKLF